MSAEEVFRLPSSLRDVLVESLNDKLKRDYDYKVAMLKRGF